MMRLFYYRNGGIIMPKLNSNFTNILNKPITDKNISEAEYRILCYLLMRAEKQDVCYPSLNTIRMSKKAIK